MNRPLTLTALRPHLEASLARAPASQITEQHDWWPLAEQLAARLGEPLLAVGVSRPSRRRRRSAPRGHGAQDATDDQLALDLGR